MTFLLSIKRLSISVLVLLTVGCTAEISESKFLLWHYLYAKYYAVQNMDRKLFETTLDHVLTAPVDRLPEKRFVNEAVKLKARHLLSQADQLFNCEDPEMAVFSYIVPERNH